MRSKTTNYVCDVCSNSVKVTTTTIPTDWITIVRKKKKRDICADCTKVIKVELVESNDAEPF